MSGTPLIPAQSESLCSWDESLTLGIPAIDDEHQVWISLVGEFCDAVKAGRGAEIIYAALVAAIEYTESHLAHEEDFMRTYRYPYFSDHKQQHDLASEEMHKFTTGHFNEEYMIAYFSEFLPNWLMYHINTSDRKMSAWMHANAPEALLPPPKEEPVDEKASEDAEE